MTMKPPQRQIERAAFWLSLGIVVLLFIGMLWTEAPFETDEPLVAATITRVEHHGDRAIAYYEVRNRGERAASEVVVRVATPDGSQHVDQTIAHLPTGTVQEGVALLYGPSSHTRPVARILGYQIP